MRSNIDTKTQQQSRAHTHTHTTQTYMHTRTHTYTHTHTHTLSLSLTHRDTSGHSTKTTDQTQTFESIAANRGEKNRWAAGMLHAAGYSPFPCIHSYYLSGIPRIRVAKELPQGGQPPRQCRQSHTACGDTQSHVISCSRRKNPNR